MDNANLPLDGPVAPNPDRELTYGEKLVRLSFNPSQNTAVYRIKSTIASAIDQMNDLRNTTDDPECKRQCSMAISELQIGSMLSVSAITL